MKLAYVFFEFFRFLDLSVFFDVFYLLVISGVLDILRVLGVMCVFKLAFNIEATSSRTNNNAKDAKRINNC